MWFINVSGLPDRSPPSQLINVTKMEPLVESSLDLGLSGDSLIY